MQRLDREHQRPFHQAVDDEAMAIGIDGRDAGMAALEVQAGGRDDAVEQMQRRARRADAGGGGIGGGRVRTTLLSNFDGWP